MRGRSEVGDLGNLKDSLPSWITDHLREGSSSFMTNEVNQSPDSPREDPPIPENVLVLVPNAWRSITCALSLWRAYKYAMSLFEFRNLYSLNNNPKSDHGWLYFKARYKKTLLRGYPSNVKGWKRIFFFTSGQEWEFSEGSSREYGVPRVTKSWSIPDKRCNNPSKMYGDKVTRVGHVFSSVEEKGLYSVPALLESKSFCRVFGPRRPMAFGEENKGEDQPTDDVPTSSGDGGANIRRILDAWEPGRLSLGSSSLSSSSRLGAMAESWLSFALKLDGRIFAFL
ncbi:hypothetical protein Acr_22g0009630 [Actinidia rufa]|uniref:Uncharacterized protein n=1 Tax=Actinidia rufa TaxID=165716 RepID=A0A7J0GLB0_9ERIC|nr:hypothetical protein Acr_22g0009630 [Actinidia rufa]